MKSARILLPLAAVALAPGALVRAADPPPPAPPSFGTAPEAAPPVQGLTKPSVIVLYNGGDPTAQGIRLAGWGSGSAVVSPDVAVTQGGGRFPVAAGPPGGFGGPPGGFGGPPGGFGGPPGAFAGQGGAGGAVPESKVPPIDPPSDQEIQVKTGGMYAGGRLIFTQPVDISAITARRSDLSHAYLDILVKAPELVNSLEGRASGQQGANRPPFGGGGPPFGGGGPPFGGGGGKFGNMQGGGAPGGGGKFGGMQGGGGPTGSFPPGAFPGGMNRQQTETPHLTNLRVIMDTTNGSGGIKWPVPPELISSTGWGHVYLPLMYFRGLTAGVNQSLTQIRLFGDNEDKFLVGQIRIVEDPTPIDLSLNESATNVDINQPVQFTAATTYASSIPVIEWNFGDGSDPVVGGTEVTHLFKRAGIYTVTATARDKNNVKTPVSEHIKVAVGQTP